MKRILAVLALTAVAVTFAYAQACSCCVPASTSATEEFGMLALNTEFVSSHPNPFPFDFAPEKGKWVTFKTADGTDGQAFEVKADKPTNNVILLIHEWWGLNDYIQQEAEKLQKALGDVTVLALDLYDKKIATTQEEAPKLMNAVKQERAVAIINGAIQYAGKEARIGTIGWCFGGGWSLQASLLAGKQAGACVMYYGMPEKDVERLKTLNAPVLGIFAKRDGWLTPALVGEFEKTMKDISKPLTMKWYDAVHAFANPSNPEHDKASTEDAYKLMVDFFKQHLVK
ncbi:MAG: dienelactone hydrolase family protein [Ignavibacteriae bacterium]|nr:dienelactone hydrolase family protein [Ignavibacteriota bacterium]